MTSRTGVGLVYPAVMASGATSADQLLATLSAEQRDAVTTTASPLCVIAGAGSGKTRVLTHRVAWQVRQQNIDPRRTLVITFTRKAASELAMRTRTLCGREKISATTFHSAALALLRRYWDHQQKPHLKLEPNRYKLLAQSNPKLDQKTLSTLDGEIAWARAQLLTPQQYAEQAKAAGRRTPKGYDFTATAYDKYQNAKQLKRLIDFDDVLALCHSTLTQKTTFADAQRWYYRHIFVDEFQDVNPLQFAVLRALLGSESTLAIVGDPNQAIYAWNGADPNLLRNIDRYFPNVAVVKLDTNFRSTPQVLNAAARIIDHEPQKAVHFDGQPPTISVTEDTQEAPTLARAIFAARKSGVPWRDQAVLARTNAQLVPLKIALQELGVPTKSRDTRLLNDPEIVDLLNTWPQTGNLATVITDERIRQTNAATADPEDSSPEHHSTTELELLISLAQDVLVLEPNATVAQFIGSLQNDDRVDTPENAVELCTFHAAKGLEWPVVHLVGLEDGLVPIAHARTRLARQEERRLLYVAATRAKQQVHVIWCHTRTIGGRRVERSPSPYLQAFETEPSDSPCAPPPEVLTLLSHKYSKTKTEPRANELLTDLHIWRDRAAKAARVNANAVVSNKTLARLAYEQPATKSELAAIIGYHKTNRFSPRLLELLNRQQGKATAH